MMTKAMPADGPENEKASTGESGTASGTPSDSGSLVCWDSHERQDLQVAARPRLKTGDEVHLNQSVKKEEALSGIAVDDDDAGNISKLEEADPPQAKPVLLGMHDRNTAEEVQGLNLSKMHDLNCTEEVQGPILPEMHDLSSADQVKGQILPEMRDLNSANKVKDPILPEMHDINSDDKVEGSILRGVHGMNSVDEIEGSILPEMHDINSANKVDDPILPEMHDINSADKVEGPILLGVHGMNSVDEVEGSILPEMHDVKSADKVEDQNLPEMHGINSADKVEGPALLGMHGMNSIDEVEGSILPEMHDVNSADKVEGPILPEMHNVNFTYEVQGSILPEMHDISFSKEEKGPIFPDMHDINSAHKVEDPTLPEMHDSSSAKDIQGQLRHSLADYGNIVKQKESSSSKECLSEVQEKVGTVSAVNRYVSMSDTDIEVAIKEGLSSKDDIMLPKNNQSDHEDDKASCCDGEKLFCSNAQSLGNIENGSDFGHVNFGDEDAAEVLENWVVQDDVNIDSETIIHVPLTDALPTLEKGGICKPAINIQKDISVIDLTSETKCESDDVAKDASVGIEFSEENLSCADTIEAHAGFSNTCSSDNLKFTMDAPDSSSAVVNESSHLKGDVSTIEDFLPRSEGCRTDASATAAKICEVKLDNSQEFLSEGSDLHMNSDCSLDGVTETKSHLALNNMDQQSSVDSHNNSSEELASREQYSTNVRKKRIDLGHQIVREIVKIQHDREQYERQCRASRQETQNHWKLEKVDKVGKKGESELEKGIGRKVLPQGTAMNGMNGSFHQAANEEGYIFMEKSVPVMKRDISREVSQSESKESTYFDKAESEDGKDRSGRKDLLNDEGMRVNDRQLSNKRHTFADAQQRVVSKGGMHYDNSSPANTGRDLNHQQNTQGVRRDRLLYDAQLSSRASNRFGSTKEAVQGQLLNTERVQPRTVGEAMNQGHPYSVTKETSHSEPRKLALRGELQFQSVQARLGTGKVFENRDQEVRKDDLAPKARPRHSSKFQNKDQSLHSREEKMGRFGNDNQLRFGPVYRHPSARTPSLPSAQTSSPQQARTPSPPTAQNETTYYFDELDAEVGSQDSFGPSASTAKISSSNGNPFQRRGTVEGRNISQVAGSTWKDASFEDAESQSARVSSEKSTIHETRTFNMADSTPTRWVNPQLEEEVLGMPVSKSNIDAGRRNIYIDSPMTNAIKIETEDADKFVVNFDTKKQKRRIGYLNLNREDGVQKSLSNFSSAPSVKGPSEQEEGLFKESGYHHSGKQIGVKDLAGKVRNMVLVASESSAQPYQSQGASGDEHPSNTTQKARLLGGLVKSKDRRRHFSNNFREDTYSSPKGAPLFDAQGSVYSDIPDSSAVKPSLELSISGFGDNDNATRIIEANSNLEVNRVAIHDEFEESWSSPSFPINSLPKVKSTEGVSSKSWRWGDVVDEADEMEFSPLEMKAENNWAKKGMAEYGGRVDTTISSLPNAAQPQKNFVEHSHHIESRTVTKDVPINIPVVLGQTSAKKSVWERLGPREAATDKLDKTNSAGDDPIMKPPYRSSKSARSYTGNTSRGSRQADHNNQETHFSEFSTLPINTGEAVVMQTYKDEKQKRGKLELYVPRRGSHNS